MVIFDLRRHLFCGGRNSDALKHKLIRCQRRGGHSVKFHRQNNLRAQRRLNLNLHHILAPGSASP